MPYFDASLKFSNWLAVGTFFPIGFGGFTKTISCCTCCALLIFEKISIILGVFFSDGREAHVSPFLSVVLLSSTRLLYSAISADEAPFVVLPINSDSGKTPHVLGG